MSSRDCMGALEFAHILGASYAHSMSAKGTFYYYSAAYLPPFSGVQRLSNSALVITLTELSAMAAPATTGLK